MGQALYRKYRSKSLSEVVGQEHVTKTLEQAIKQKRISHAYLFTGPRGIGKTSVARILAHEINGLPYVSDDAHIDIIEIDAASNRRIDEIRDLRDKVHISPTSAKYKVYIIDEVHMLTREAFNALLKTLEEPPEHVVFILATTDAHKLPDTIVSRTQRFNFKPASQEDLTKLISKVAKAEKIKVKPEAIELLAEHSDGSFRDSLSLLDQARSFSEEVDIVAVQDLFGLPPGTEIQALMEAVNNRGPETLAQQLSGLYKQGFPAATIAKQLGNNLRADIVNGSSGHDRLAKLALLSKLIEVPAAFDPERYLEIILLQAASEGAIEPVVAAPKQEVVTPAKSSPKQTASKQLSNDELWPAVLQALKSKHNTLYGIVRMAKPSFVSENALQLTFAFAFHQKRLNEAANHQLLLNTIAELTGRNLTVECLLDSSSVPAEKAAPSTKATEDDSLSTINNIFSGAELLES